MAEVKHIAVVGAGRIGAGIAQISAIAGYQTIVHDADPDKTGSVLNRLDAQLTRARERGRINAADAEEALARILPAVSIAQIAPADLVIEAVTEDFSAKRAVLGQIDEIVCADCVRASSTSSMSITRLASLTVCPAKLIGLHFMNPAPAMKLVEVVRGLATDDDTYRTATQVVEKMGKTCVNCEDFPGFIVNRILLSMINEAVYTLYEGVGSVETIDTALHLGANHPMGPLQLADFIGLDTVLSVLQAIHDGLADPKYRPCPLLVKYVEAGWTGQKSGRGFYDYHSDPPLPTR